MNTIVNDKTCTGCDLGLPISELGFHHTGAGVQQCPRARRRLELEPMSTDTWHRPAARKRARVPFVVGGGA